MDNLNENKLEDFYVAYIDQSGRPIFPTTLEEVKTIRNLMKEANSSSIAFAEDGNTRYKIRVKRKIIEGKMIQILEASNVTEFIKQIDKAHVDEVTNLGNRRIARQQFMDYLTIARRKAEDFAIIIADLDDFKTVNDTYGHTNGDVVLSEISKILYSSTRQDADGFRGYTEKEKDIVARLGGDEFVVIMKNVTKEIAYARAERIRSSVEQREITLFTEKDYVKKIKAGTISVGVYHVTYPELMELYRNGYTSNQVREVLIDRCDSATYASKENGKNQVTKYEGEHQLSLKQKPRKE